MHRLSENFCYPFGNMTKALQLFFRQTMNREMVKNSFHLSFCQFVTAVILAQDSTLGRMGLTYQSALFQQSWVMNILTFPASWWLQEHVFFVLIKCRLLTTQFVMTYEQGKYL